MNNNLKMFLENSDSATFTKINNDEYQTNNSFVAASCGSISDVRSEEETDSSENTSNQWVSNLSFDQMIDIENHIYEMIDDYIQTEIHNMSAPKFHENIIADISILLHLMLVESNLYNCGEDNLPEVEVLVENICVSFFQTNAIPPRSHLESYPKECSIIEFQMVKSKIDALRQVYQPKQRTTEWYEFRHNLITASNIWKIFGTESNRNSIICEKCRPLIVIDPSITSAPSINTNSTLHHGVKYEPLSVKIYQLKYNTKIEDFGCIQHPKYPFIGASPDGINVLPETPSSGRFGRMIEVKNIFNREINGIPKQEYWVQMQIQMETCDLDDCDFIETRFKEYENVEQFYQTECKMSNGSVSVPEYKGIILYFIERPVSISTVSNSIDDPDSNQKTIHMNEYVNKNNVTTAATHPTENQYQYVYLDPIHYSNIVGSSREHINAWIEKQKTDLASKYILYDTIYWYLDEFSCVLVERNKEWFNSVLPQIKEVWNIIERERVEGYEHRISARVKQNMIKKENRHQIHIAESAKFVSVVKMDSDAN